ncbi:hypothetical protein SAMN04515671_1642 [Nakamurella panacisegetis]|uniref:Restriction alleviation protein Lar n=1 Tax=Nakamurella panacisegetis TaxID=1090615 RepID=A0A1H0LF75_9ACTN|nr:hypothetical protein SAMN04515671_1642 [Nakamurella panacisegetis]
MTAGYKCPVCGYPGLTELPRTNEGGGSYEICWSCGFEFGVTDDDRGYTYDEWRAMWVERGMPWDSGSLHPKPEGWDPQGQLADL